jgi:hypothetical protein
LACKGVPANVGAAGARDISNEFAHRPWHAKVTCVWDGSQLILQAENDFDSNGLALVHEFSDAIAVCIAGGFDGNIEILSIQESKSDFPSLPDHLRRLAFPDPLPSPVARSPGFRRASGTIQPSVY